MSVDLFRAAAPATLSTLTGIFIGYIVFKKFITSWYGESKNSSKVAWFKYWLGVISCISIAEGISKISGEFFYLAFNDSSIRGDNIFKGLVTFIVLPLILSVIGYILGVLFGNPRISSSKFSKSPGIYNQQLSTLEVDDSAWEQALKEVDGADRHMATWAKALADSAGNTELARSIYIKQRANHIHIKSSIQSNFLLEDEGRLISEQQNRDHIRSFWISIALVLICGGFLIFGAIRNS